MHSSYYASHLRRLGLAALVCGLGFAAGSAADAAPAGKGKGKGNKPAPQAQTLSDKGKLELELYRGAVADPEETTLATPNACRGRVDLSVEWDSSQDRVKLRLRGKNVLTPNSDANRSDKHYRYNSYAPEPQHVEGGQYRLWIIAASGPATRFYYDKSSYDLLGGGPGYFPPKDPSTYVAIDFPTEYAFATKPFQPSGKGDVDQQWSFSYSSPQLGETPEHSYYVLAHVPPNLCEYNEFRPHLTTLRPFVAGPVPRAAAHPWSDYVRGGLTFKLTLEPVTQGGPPTPSSLVTYSNTMTVPGLVPRGWTRDWIAARALLAPLITPWDGANQCTDIFAGFQTGPDTCTPK